MKIPRSREEERNSVKDIQEQVRQAQAAITGMRRFVRVEAETEKCEDKPL